MNRQEKNAATRVAGTLRAFGYTATALGDVLLVAVDGCEIRIPVPSDSDVKSVARYVSHVAEAAKSATQNIRLDRQLFGQVTS